MPTFWPVRRTWLVAGGLVLALLAILILGREGERRGPLRPRPPPALTLSPLQAPLPVTVCITRQGLCTVEPLRPGDPCSCPDALRGSIRGHAEWLGQRPALPRARDWPERDLEETDDWVGFPGP